MLKSFRAALWTALTPPGVLSVLKEEAYGAERDLLDAINVLENAQCQADYKRKRLLRIRAMIVALEDGREITDVSTELTMVESSKFHGIRPIAARGGNV
jgi:hypothetical protein